MISLRTPYPFIRSRYLFASIFKLKCAVPDRAMFSMRGYLT